MRWWGWGDPAHPTALPEHALGFLRETVGVSDSPHPPVALEAVRLPQTRLRESAKTALQAIVGPDGVRDDHGERVAHAAGKSYPDLVRLRAGAPEGAPDAVVLPSSHEQVRVVLAECERSSLAVVPFGGGTSVMGGVEPLRGEHDGVIALDMRRIVRIAEPRPRVADRDGWRGHAWTGAGGTAGSGGADAGTLATVV